MFCFFATSGKNPFNLLGLKKLKKKDKEKEVAPSSIPIDEGIQWEKNFYKMISHYWEIGLKKNLNVVLLYLQLKEGVKPTAKATITKSLLEEEYDLLGYTVYRLNDEKGRVRYGTHTVPLFDGPPYIEDIREQDKNGGTITFTIGDFGKPIQEIHIPIKDVIAQKADDYIAKNTPNGSPQKTNTFNPPSQGGQSTFAKIQQAKLISGQKNTPNTNFNDSINQRAQSPFGDTIHTENGRLSPVAQHPQKNLNNAFNNMTSPKKAPKVLTANNFANQNPTSTQPSQQKNPQSRQRPPSISFKPDTLKPPSRFNNTDKNKPNLVIDRNTPTINIGNLDSNKNNPQPSQAPPKKKKPKRPTSEKKPNRVKMVQRDMQQQPPK